PLWRGDRSRRPNIRVNSKLLEVTTAGAAQTGLGAATATNADGTRAWILSPEELSALKPKILAERTEVTETSITVYNGGPARATLGPGRTFTPLNASPI